MFSTVNGLVEIKIAKPLNEIAQCPQRALRLPSGKALGHECINVVRPFTTGHAGLESQKGSRQLTRKPRKRGGVARQRGVGKAHDCLLFARDRTGQTLDFHTGRCQVTAQKLRECLGPVLPADALLISDSAASYRLFAREAGITHEVVNAKAGVRARGALNIQSVNAWHSRFDS